MGIAARWPLVLLLALSMALAGDSLCRAGLPLGVRGVGAVVAWSSFQRHDTRVLSNSAVGLWGEKRLAPLASLLWEVNYTALGGALVDKPMYGVHGIYAYDFTLRWAFVEVPVLLSFEVPVTKRLRALFFSGPSLLLYQKNLSQTQRRRYLHPWQPGERWEYVWLNDYRPLELRTKRWGYHLGLGIRLSTFLLSADYFQLNGEVADMVSSIYRVRRRIHAVRLQLRWELAHYLPGGKEP